MAATSIFFNGRLIRRPGSYSEVDATGLEAVGLGAAGIVALIGTSVGGRPVNTISEVIDIPRFSNAEAADSFARSGDLREAAAMAFAPSNDEAIQGGAAEVVMLKVNPATQSEATFSNTDGPAITITAADYGEFTNQIQITIANGTNQGKLVTATFEDTTESVDDIGGDTMFSLTYHAPASAAEGGLGWQTMTAEVISSGVRANATRQTGNLSTDRLLTQTGAFTAVSSAAGDTTQTITVIGVDGGTAVIRSAQLNGTTSVSLGNFSGGVFGAFLDEVAVGTVDVDAAGTNLTIAIGDLATGCVKMNAGYVANAPVTVTPNAGTPSNDVYVVGRLANGTRAVDTLTNDGAGGAVTGAANFIEVEALCPSSAADVMDFSATAAQSSNTSQDTLQKVADFFNARQAANAGDPADPFGFQLTLVTGLTTLDAANLDLTSSAASVLSPASVDFLADLFFLEQAIDSSFSLINATREVGAVGVPDNTTSPVFLTGGTEGTTTFSEWQAALNLLKRIGVSTIVPLTSDAAVHAALKAHCEFMGGIGRNERDGIVGLQDVATSSILPPLADITSQIVALNTRHLRACGQNIQRFNVEGERTTFAPYFQAVLGAGMQAGSGVGVSLTNKVANCLSVDQDTSWNPIDDAELLIERGLFFMEEVENVGRRWVRNITTNVSSSNIAFTEASVNEAVNFAVFNFRTNLEFAVGEPGFSGTINATKSVAQNTLGLLVDTGVLTTYRSLQISLALDVLDVSVEIAPVIPINFVRSVLHLVNQVQTAA
jgi:hypothetical protein